MNEESITALLAHRSMETQDLAIWFAFDHIKDDFVREYSEKCCELALGFIATLPDGEMLTQGLRDLLRAKDCFVRAALASVPRVPVVDS